MIIMDNQNQLVMEVGLPIDYLVINYGTAISPSDLDLDLRKHVCRCIDRIISLKDLYSTV